MELGGSIGWLAGEAGGAEGVRTATRNCGEGWLAAAPLAGPVSSAGTALPLPALYAVSGRGGCGALHPRPRRPLPTQLQRKPAAAQVAVGPPSAREWARSGCRLMWARPVWDRLASGAQPWPVDPDGAVEGHSGAIKAQCCTLHTAHQYSFPRASFFCLAGCLPGCPHAPAGPIPPTPTRPTPMRSCLLPRQHCVCIQGA